MKVAQLLVSTTIAFLPSASALMDKSRTKKGGAFSEGARKLKEKDGSETFLRSPHRRAQCLVEAFDFTTEAGCTERGLDEFFDELQQVLDEEGCANDAVEELMGVLDVGSGEDVYMHFIDLCNNFWESQETINFREFMDGTDVFMSEFFDGGTNWNGLRQTVGDRYVLAEDPGALIELYQTKAETAVMEFPDEVQNPVVSNFANCDSHAVMCCWVKDRQANDDNGNCEDDPSYDEGCNDADPADNVDVCYVDMARAPESSRTPEGWAFFPGESEGDAHCHGVAWGNGELDETQLFKGNTLFFVSLYDHLHARGYVKNIPGAPMCSCVEQQAVVDRADCTEPEVIQNVRFEIVGNSLEVDIMPFQVEFNACVGVDEQENDLLAFYQRLAAERRLSDDTETTLEMMAAFQATVVGDDNCPIAMEAFLTNFLLVEN